MPYPVPDKPWSKGDIVRGADGAGLGGRPFVMEHEPFLVQAYFCRDRRGDIISVECPKWLFGRDVDASQYVLATEADAQFYLRIAQEDFDRAEKDLTYATNILNQIRLAELHGRSTSTPGPSVNP